MTRNTVPGFIGLGDIGAPMAGRIVQGGYRLRVWNRTASKIAPLLSAGAAAETSPAGLGQTCDMVFTCLSTLDGIHDVLFGDHGVVKARERRATLVVDCSTIPPQAAREIAVELSRSGVGFLDAPVSGGPVGARAGTLATMAGGLGNDLQRARGIIGCYSSQITHMGPVGAGQAMKACNQVINFGTIAALAEAISLGSRYGIEDTMIAKAITGGFAESNISREFLRSIAVGEFSPVRFLVDGLSEYYQGRIDPDFRGRLDILMKDLDMALEMGREKEAPMPVIAHFDAVFRLLHYQGE